MTDNPYAPPRADLESSAPPFDSLTHRSVALMVVLTFVTIGYYGFYWLFRTTREVGARVSSRTSRATGFLVATIVVAVGDVALFAIGLVDPYLIELDAINRVWDLVFSITQLAWVFWVRDMLQSFVSKHGLGPYPLSAAGTFFLGIFYVQYKINRMPEPRVDETSAAAIDRDGHEGADE